MDVERMDQRLEGNALILRAVDLVAAEIEQSDAVGVFEQLVAWQRRRGLLDRRAPRQNGLLQELPYGKAPAAAAAAARASVLGLI